MRPQIVSKGYFQVLTQSQSGFPLFTVSDATDHMEVRKPNKKF